MSTEVFILCLTAFSVGVVHTIFGPDHYLPFVAMSKAGGWTARKTLWVTVACGLGHVAGSVAIGAFGLLLGTAVMRLEAMESVRGDIAGWLLIGFGLASLTWGILRPARKPPHAHQGGRCHVHGLVEGSAAGAEANAWGPWILFLLFVFGPCEPLIPLLMYPAAEANAVAVAAVAAAFSLATVGTMTITVLVMRYGLSFMSVPFLGQYGHVASGLTILACGLLVKVGL